MSAYASVYDVVTEVTTPDGAMNSRSVTLRFPMQDTKNWLFIAATLAGLGATIVLTFISRGQYRYNSISPFSACVLNTTEWQIPMTDITYWRSSSVAQTPLSKSIAVNHLAPEIPQTWLFATGGGNGVRCAIGNGRRLLNAVLSSDVATFIDADAKYHDREEARRWSAALLDPLRSEDVSMMIRASPVPPDGFKDKQAFEQWLHEVLENCRLFNVNIDYENAAAAAQTRSSS